MSRQSEIVKESITESLFILMRKKNFDEISIKEITQKAGVGRVSFYRHFESKEDIIVKHLDSSLKAWGAEWEASGDPDVVFQIFKYFHSQKDLIELIIKARLENIFIHHLLYACGYNEADHNIVAYGKSMFAYGLFGWCLEWFKRGMQETPEEMANLVSKINAK